MAVQQNKKSRSRRDMRRSHDALLLLQYQWIKQAVKLTYATT